MLTFTLQKTLIIGFLVLPVMVAQSPRVSVPTSERATGLDTVTVRTAARGRVNVMAVLTDPPLAQAIAASRPAGAPRKSVHWTRAQQIAYVQSLQAKQATVIGPAQSLGATVRSQLTKAANAVIFNIESSRLPALRGIAGVASVVPVRSYTARATAQQTAEYIGAGILRARTPSIDGTGVRVAVLDSGIDWTHKNLGGPGTTAAYAAVYGTPAGARCGPTAENTSAAPFNSKVIGGFDFVGENWPINTPFEEFDPNPIDCQGHGTAVADILAGRSNDGTWKGVAPGAQLYAVKTCSAVNSSCSGLGILLGLDFALDPNRDSDLSDAVDVVNMSLGLDYGLREDSSSYAAQIVAQFGVVVVSSSGNAGDAPYVTGSPAQAPEVISVAETQVNDAFTFPLVLNPAVSNPSCSGQICSNTVYQPWSQLPVADITGPLFIPTANALGCDPFATSLSGRIVLIRRGTCDVSLKVSNAGAAGAIGVIIDNNVAGDPPIFALGEGSAPFPTTLTITQSLGNTLRAVAGTNVTGGKVVATATISRSLAVSFAGSMVISSSRGPSNAYTSIKPDIGAPGGSEAALVGSGSGLVTFSGTSGAAPVVSGAAALVLQAHPTATPVDVKARLMNTADANVFINPATMPGVLAPVTRIGAGEVRVAKAADATAAMWDAANPFAVSLSFGYSAVPASRIFRKRVVVQNYSSTAKTWNIATSFRYASDASSGAVVFTAPSSVVVPANSSTAFNLTASVDPARLPVWRNTGVNSGSNGANGSLLQSVEYDGYVTLTSGGETLSLPWHLLPRRSHNATAGALIWAAPNGSFQITNPSGATAAPFDVFDLLAVSPALPRSAFPQPGEERAVTDLAAVGIRPVNIGAAPGSWAGNVGVQFGVSTHNSWTHANTFPSIAVLIDSNNDGTDDWVVLNAATTSNTNTMFVASLGECFGSDGVTPALCPFQSYFHNIVDLNSAVMQLTIPAAPVYNGSAQTVIPVSGKFRMQFLALDDYFTGDVTDTAGPATYNLSAPKYVASVVQGSAGVGSATTVNFSAVAGGAAQSPGQSGFLVLFRDGQPGREAATVVVP